LPLALRTPHRAALPRPCIIAVCDPYLAYDAPIDGKICIRDGKVEQANAYGFVEVGHLLNQVLDQVKNKIYDRHLDVVYDAESSVYLAIGG